MTEELSKGFTGIEINGVRFSNIKEMLIYMNKQRVCIINLENENAELRYQLNKNPCVKTPEWYCSDCLKENAELKEELKAKQAVLNDFKSRVETVTDRFNRKSSQLTYAKTIIQDLLDNTDEYARQRAEDFLKENK